MKIVYFDRNVFDWLKRRFSISDFEYRLIRKSIECGRINIPLSYVVIEETLPILKSSFAVRHEIERQLINELFDQHHPIKRWVDLLRNDVVCFANERPSITPFMNALVMSNDEILDPTPQFRDRLIEIIEELNASKESASKVVKVKRKQAQENRIFPKCCTIDKLWEDHSLHIAELTAKDFGVLEECSARGLSKLLELKSIKLHTAWYVSYVYSTAVMGEKIRPSDSVDHQHTVSASVADIFVTEDGPLARLLRRIPIQGFEVMPVSTFLRRLQYWDDWQLASRG